MDFNADEVVLTVTQAEELEKMLLASPGGAIRIMRSPYNEGLITVSSDAVGETEGTSIAEAMAKFLDLVLSAGPEVSEVEVDEDEDA